MGERGVNEVVVWRQRKDYFFFFFVFFFNDTATTEIYTLSLHDALPIWREVNKHAMLVHNL